MKHCNEFEELISAYVDGMLDSSDKLYLEEHLRSCRSCLNLLALYHGMSVSIKESCTQAPPSIRKTVMDVLKSPSATGIVTPSYHDEIDEDVIARTKKRKRMRTILTRYAPIAACLAIALLVLPQFLNIDRAAYNEAAPPAPMAMPEMVYDEAIAAATFGDGEDLELVAEEELNDWSAVPDAPQAVDDDATGGRAAPVDGDVEPQEGRQNMGEQRLQGGGWSMNDSLLDPEYVASSGYYAFIMIEHEFTSSFELIAYYGDYHLIEQFDVAGFIEQYGAYVVYFIPGDDAAGFALVQFVI